MKRLENTKDYLLIFTVAYIVIIAIVFSPFILSGSSLVGFNDSYLQHYPFVFKIKAFYEELIINHKLNLVSFYDCTGLDVLDLYTYYGLGNPFSLFFLGWKADYIPYVFSVVSILKLYFGGLAFLYLGHELEFDRRTTLLCALLYVVNPVAIAALEQFCFLDILYQFPLLVAGVHQIIERKKSRVFPIVLTVVFMCGFYWLYIQTLLLMGYALFYIFTYKTDGKNKLLLTAKTVMNTAKYYIFAFLASAWIFIPSILNLTEIYRSTSSYKYSLLLYPLSDLQEMMKGYLLYNSNNWVTICFVHIPVLFFMFINIKKYKVNLAVYIVLYLLTFVPLVGYIGNGFSYPTNRWFAGVNLFLLLLCVRPMTDWTKNISFSKKIFACSILLIGIIQPLMFTFFYSQICLSPAELKADYNSKYAETVNADERVDYNRLEHVSGVVFNFHNKMNIYNSLLPKNIINGYLIMGLSTVEDTNILSGLDYRSELEALFNVNKYLALENSPIPYGFKKIYRDEEGIMYENIHPVHFGYTYESFVNESDSVFSEKPSYSWNALNGCMVREEYVNDVCIPEIKADNSLLKEVSFRVSEKSDSQKLVSFDTLHNCEVYIKVRMLNANNVNIRINALGNSSVRRVWREDAPWSINRDYYYFNLGYCDKVSECTLICCDEYTVEGVFFHPMDDYIEQVEKLDEYHMENVKFGTNTITGNIYVPDNRLLCLTVPYQNGWKAEVDGIETKIIPVNGFSMGINLTPGKHDIKLSYTTPGLIAGFVITVATLLMTVVVGFILLLKKKKHLNNR